MKNNITKVVEDNLCIGCGACSAICPTKAIKLSEGKLVYQAEVDQEMCTDCGLCTRVCPGKKDIDPEELRKFRDDEQEKDDLLGSYDKIFFAYDKNSKNRNMAASGGFITAFLEDLLNERRISAALVVTDGDDPLRPEAVLAKSCSDISKSKRSKYCPVSPFTILDSLNEVKGKVAVVGLPCHIAALRRAEQVKPNLSNKILVRIGIFCGQTPTFESQRVLLANYGIKSSEVKSIHYRGNGWPGYNTIKFGEKNKNIITHSEAWCGSLSMPLNIAPRCLVCSDGLAEYADISAGDAWLPEIMSSDSKGTSLVISRGADFTKLVEGASSRIALVESDKNAVKVSQKTMLSVKRKNAISRKKMFRFLMKSAPTDGLGEKGSLIKSAIFTIIYKIFPRKLVNILPVKVKVIINALLLKLLG